jgi:preprotein translocase subunit SecG
VIHAALSAASAVIAATESLSSMLLNLLLTLNVMVCIALICVVLLQRSEGGAFGGGSPTGLITTRGAGDLLTRTTWILFATFLALSLALTLLGAHERSDRATLNRLKGLTINPDSIKKPGPPAPATNSAPAPVQLPPIGGASPARPPSGPAPTPSTPAAASGVTLPPLSAPSK